jgi:hypothetical protein
MLFLGTAIWVFGLLSKKDLLAGIGLSLTTVRPHIALVLAIPMLIRYRRVFLAFFFSAGLLALFSMIILGLNGIQGFINVLLITAGGDWYGIHQDAMVNLIGLLMRSLPLETDAIRVIGWAVYGITIMFSLWSEKILQMAIGLGHSCNVSVPSTLPRSAPCSSIYLLIRSTRRDAQKKVRRSYPSQFSLFSP